MHLQKFFFSPACILMLLGVYNFISVCDVCQGYVGIKGKLTLPRCKHTRENVTKLMRKKNIIINNTLTIKSKGNPDNSKQQILAIHFIQDTVQDIRPHQGSLHQPDIFCMEITYPPRAWREKHKFYKLKDFSRTHSFPIDLGVTLACSISNLQTAHYCM